MIVQIENLIEKYNALHLHSILHYDKFNQYAITHHSTTIEGSTLTIEETRLLLDEGLTPKGKPLQHSLMAKDHYEALLFVLKSASKKNVINPQFIQTINAAVMHSTGAVYNTALGSVDASKGEYRKGNVSAGNTYFVNFDKVPAYTEKLCTRLNEAVATAKTFQEKLDTSFIAHFDLVSIHPFYDGNGRTSRLLMNFIQQIFGLPLAIVFTEDKAAYYQALQQTREQEDTSVFLYFMYSQYEKYLKQEITAFQQLNEKKAGGEKGFSFVF